MTLITCPLYGKQQAPINYGSMPMPCRKEASMRAYTYARRDMDTCKGGDKTTSCNAKSLLPVQVATGEASTGHFARDSCYGGPHPMYKSVFVAANVLYIVKSMSDKQCPCQYFLEWDVRMHAMSLPSPSSKQIHAFYFCLHFQMANIFYSNVLLFKNFIYSNSRT